MNFKKTTPILTMMLLLTTLTTAFSMSPGSYRFEYDEINGLDEEFGFQLRSSSNEPILIDVLVLNSLKEYLEISNETRTINPNGAEIINVRLKLPPNLDLVGQQEAQIAFTKRLPESQKGGFMGFTTEYRARIIVTFAYPGEYINIISLNPTNVNEGENTEINFEVQARGMNITSVINKLQIKNTTNQTIYQKEYPIKYLSRNERYKEKEIINSQDYKPGEYTVILTATTANNTDELQKTLRIGEENIELIKFNPTNFTTGQIMEYSVLLENQWNDEFKNVYATLTINDTTTTTKSITLKPFEQKEINNQYINIAHLDEGNHDAQLIIHFDEHSKIFDLNLIGIKPEKQNNTTQKLIISLTATFLILIILALSFIFIKQNKK
ncbi:MAG: hypothetical protein ACLFN8_03590 [Candidatus Woesearchaeota archaeon]